MLPHGRHWRKTSKTRYFSPYRQGGHPTVDCLTEEQTRVICENTRAKKQGHQGTPPGAAEGASPPPKASSPKGSAGTAGGTPLAFNGGEFATRRFCMGIGASSGIAVAAAGGRDSTSRTKASTSAVAGAEGTGTAGFLRATVGLAAGFGIGTLSADPSSPMRSTAASPIPFNDKPENAAQSGQVHVIVRVQTDDIAV